jgi:hypothetical protein
VPDQTHEFQRRPLATGRISAPRFPS